MSPAHAALRDHRVCHGGAGLGLAITKKLGGLQNGTMSFDSELGVGSVFRVTFPGANAIAKAV